MFVPKLSQLKKLFFFLTVVILLITIKLFHKVKDHKHKRIQILTEPNNTSSLKPPPKTFLKVFHIDLKGGPPKIKFLFTILPVIRRSGANAILLEYEDMFPFTGKLRNISAANAYSFRALQAFIEFADILKMEVIPLVQTFGHLEYVLKLEEFSHLREVSSFPQEICPEKKEAVELVKEMVRQVMKLHSKAKYIHIGCDEVRHLGVCSRCSRINFKTLFSKHVIKISDYIRAHYPGVTPLIWDDMLRKWPYQDLIVSGLGSSVEPVVWIYGDNIFTLVPPFIWNNYQATFPRIWAASAFKGAFGEKETIPNLTRHARNHISWTNIITGAEPELKNVNFSGIFLTGWSRYDHFAVLCELLPVGIPSLILGLLLLDPQFSMNPLQGVAKWLDILGCPKQFVVIAGRNESFYQDKLGMCSFRGSKLYSGMVELQKLKDRLSKLERKIEANGWSTRYNFRKNFTSPWRLLELFQGEGFTGETLRKDLAQWKLKFGGMLKEFFDEYTEKEWTEQNVEPLEERLKELQWEFEDLMRRKTWPRRPLR